jgi:hypothetical protein
MKTVINCLAEYDMCFCFPYLMPEKWILGLKFYAKKAESG